MKTRLMVAILLISCISCETNNKPLTDTQKERIKEEVKTLISTIVQVCENPDAEKLKAIFIDSPDFVSLVGGTYADYEESLKNLDGFFANVSSQKATIKSEKYSIIDATTVLYTANSKWETNFKNNSTVVFEPLGMQFLLKKVNNQWKVLSWTEEIK